MIMGRLFGTDGVRGVANQELTAELAFSLGQAGAYVLSQAGRERPKIVVGMDTRISSPMLECALVAGVCSVGADCICVGVIPTPAVAVLTRQLEADAGVVISASHNPFTFNGIKFFNGSGHKLSDDVEEKIEEIILDKAEPIPHALHEKIGKKWIMEDANVLYQEFLLKAFSPNLTGMKIAIDCANGAVFEIVPAVLRKLGAEVLVMGDKPDGLNINFDCGSTYMRELQKTVKEGGYDIGLAFDGDGDRVLACDEKGQLVDGDKLMSVLALYLKENGNLPHNTLVATVMSNLGLDLMAKREGLNIQKTQVGDRYVLEKMMKSGYALGGEQSGHIILLQYNTTGDGPLTALLLLQILKQSGKTMSDLASVMEVYPQVLMNAKVNSLKKQLYLQDKEIENKCKELENEFCGEGRVLIRPSGTEPMVRVMIEGKNVDQMTRRAKELVDLIETRLV